MAVLYRINARSEPYEEAFAAAGIPYQVRDGAFLRRPGPRSVLARLRRADERRRASRPSRRPPTRVGYDPDAEPDDAEEVTRQADLGRLRALAAEYAAAHADGDVAGFVAELARAVLHRAAGRGVNLLTYHRAKGLEFDAVFLPRLLDKELPFRSRRVGGRPGGGAPAAYVGITRARTPPVPVVAARAADRAEPVPGELGRRPRPAAARPTARRRGEPVSVGTAGGGPLFDRLKRMAAQARGGRRRARLRRVPRRDARRDRRGRRSDWADLAAIPGVGPAKLERYADEVLADRRRRA